MAFYLKREFVDIEMKVFMMMTASPLGNLRLMGNPAKGLTGLLFQEEACPYDVEEREIPLLQAAQNWLFSYFSGERPKEKLPLAPEGTAFQKEIWSYLLSIPYGTYQTYGDIAKRVEERTKRKMSSQAVGQALKKNPIPIFIPCHRVLGKHGKLTGYAGGIDRKLKLLEVEHISYIK